MANLAGCAAELPAATQCGHCEQWATPQRAGQGSQTSQEIIEGYLVLPEHLHCIWTLPAGDADYMNRWRLIKTWFTKHCDPVLRGAGVWQKRYWEHVLRDEHDYARHVDYIHYNPVKHGLVASVGDWSYSSFERFVKAGVYPPDWGSEGMVFEVVGDE